MLPWVIAAVLGAVGLTVGIELLMIRLGIRPADPDARSGGFRDVAEKVNRWSAQRRADHQDRQNS